MHFLLVTEYQMLEEPILNKVFVNARQDCITGVILGQELMIELIKMNSSRWVSGNPEMKLRPDQWASASSVLWFSKPIASKQECHLSFLTNQLFPKLTDAGLVGWYRMKCHPVVNVEHDSYFYLLDVLWESCRSLDPKLCKHRKEEAIKQCMSLLPYCSIEMSATYHRWGSSIRCH